VIPELLITAGHSLGGGAMSLLTLVQNWASLVTRLMLATALFAIEIKEPYVFKYACLFVLVACYTAAPLPRKAK
jgi:hypothetical protein